MRKGYLLVLLVLQVFHAIAGGVGGSVTDEKGQALAYASILVKGTTVGTTANKDGQYFLQLDPGTYTIVAQYVGYNRSERSITLGRDSVKLNFRLSVQQLSLKEVVVRPGAEDPAYEIIRNAIKKRSYYLNQLDKFQCEVYIKGQLQLRDYPKTFLGSKVEFEDGDTSKRKMLFLSETMARYSVQKPRKSKIEVLSTRVSGNSESYGLSSPQIVSFYQNNVEIGSNLNPRGFISPIADNALQYYRYKYEGSFIEDGREINRIRVIPRRRYEPLLSGYINITEGDWRIHSLQMQLTKASQMELLDTLNIEQLYVPYDKDVWVIKTQVIYPAVKLFRFDAYGSFVNVYSKFNIDPSFGPKFFNSTFLKVYEGANKKPTGYWDTMRPIPLQVEEIADYRRKDSLELVRQDPHYLDSLDKQRNKLKPLSLLVFGQIFSRERRQETLTIPPVIKSLVAYNTVEGWSGTLGGIYNKKLDTIPYSRRAITIEPYVRYGISNKHLNASGAFTYTRGKKQLTSFTVAGGKWIYQFNNANPITQFSNTVRSWLFERNYAKFYETWFGRFGYTQSVGNGFTIMAGLRYEDRIPLENTSYYSFGNRHTVEFTPNYPVEIMSGNFKRHQAMIANLGFTWTPGSQYIELPDRIVNTGSSYPTFTFNYFHGLHKVLGSDVDFSKWRLEVTDNVNMNMLGVLRYKFIGGGFLRGDSVGVMDYTHFNGNQILATVEYLNGFQLLPYYQYSNKDPWYVQGHIEHHFKGFLSNKIPLFRKLNWYFVTGANAFYVNREKSYLELFYGLDNILKLFRVDMVYGYERGLATNKQIRLGIHGFGRF